MSGTCPVVLHKRGVWNTDLTPENSSSGKESPRGKTGIHVRGLPLEIAFYSSLP